METPSEIGGLVRPICVLKSHVSAPFFATIQCLTQKQVDKNIYVYKTHTFFWWVEICIYIYISIYIHQMYTIYLYPSTSSKFSWHSSRQTATGAPHWGQANVAWDVLRLRESLGAGAQALKDERWVVFFFGVGKNNHSQLPKEKGKGDTFYWNYVTRVRTFFFFL